MHRQILLAEWNRAENNAAMAKSRFNSLRRSSRPQVGPGEESVPNPAEETDPHTRSILSLFFGKLPLENETSLFILVSALDFFMTYLLLQMDMGFFESNPIANYFIARWNVRGMIAFKFGIVAFVCVLSQVIALKDVTKARAVLYIGIVIVFGVVVYSATLFLRTSGLL